ncbi:MAG: hypothetical protein L6R36_007292 [Xanthoria steineri]|nr:MAG: hypothetical protein L6R36_007292 [Xanthoria steineri]
MEIGYKAGISDDQLYDLPREDTTRQVGNGVLSAWNERRIQVWNTLFEVFGRQYCLAAVSKVINDLLSFAQPQLLYKPGSNETVACGLLIAVGMFTASFIQTICMNQYLAIFNETSMKMKATLTAIVYDKATT